MAESVAKERKGNGINIRKYGQSRGNKELEIM